MAKFNQQGCVMRLLPSLLLALVAIAIPVAAASQILHLDRNLRIRASAPNNQSSESVWVGTYVFSEGGGRTAGGAGMFVQHTVVIHKQSGALLADIDADGYQTSKSLRCSTKIEGNRINLYFQSYREDNIGEPYRKGQLLLTLEQSSIGSRTRILTYWGAYKPIFMPARNGRVYFKKTNNQ